MRPVSAQSMALVATPITPGSLLFAGSRPAAPPPLTAFHLMQPLSISLVDPAAYPDLPEPSNDLPSATHDCYGSPSSSKGDLQLAVREFRGAEAARCGCGVSDIAWFLETHLEVSDGDMSHPQHSTSAACSGSLGKQTLSYSSSCSSGPCVASFGLMYVHMSIDNAASVRAQDVLAGAAPGALPTPPFPELSAPPCLESPPAVVILLT